LIEQYSECRNFVCQPIYYPFYERDLAIGQSAAQSGIAFPSNYNETVATNEIINSDDENGDEMCDLKIPSTDFCTIYREGDNHFGYIGFRDHYSQNDLVDDGVINKIIELGIGLPNPLL
jgi:hypothetical protein